MFKKPKDFQKLEELMKKGSEVKVYDKFGRTPLMYACSMKNKDIIDFLIKKGADVNEVGSGLLSDQNPLTTTMALNCDPNHYRLFLMSTFNEKLCRNLPGHAVVLDNNNKAYFLINSELIEFIEIQHRDQIPKSESDQPQEARQVELNCIPELVNEARIKLGESSLEIMRCLLNHGANVGERECSDLIHWSFNQGGCYVIEMFALTKAMEDDSLERLFKMQNAYFTDYKFSQLIDFVLQAGEKNSLEGKETFFSMLKDFMRDKVDGPFFPKIFNYCSTENKQAITTTLLCINGLFSAKNISKLPRFIKLSLLDEFLRPDGMLMSSEYVQNFLDYVISKIGNGSNPGFCRNL